MFWLPPDVVSVINISHPQYRGVAALGLQWTAIPAISDFVLDVGGLVYSCCPFNGWFMETEICRDLLDVQRYNLEDQVIEACGLDVGVNCLAKDHAQLIMNQAVLHSFSKQSYSIVGHDACSVGFMKFHKSELEIRKRCPAD